MENNILRVALVLFLLAPLSARAVPILLTDSSGQLAGATGVTVDGSLYDVYFVEGSCEQVFSGCDSVSDFFFDSATARLASLALIDTVAIDGAVLYDTEPELTVGCEDLGVCAMFTPFGFDQFGQVDTWFGSNKVSGDFINDTAFPTDWDYSDVPTRVWAVWRNAGDPLDVAEPYSLALIGIGFCAIALARQGQTLS